MELNNLFKEQYRREDIVSKQAFSKQRCNLNPEVFKALNVNYVKGIYQDEAIKKYKGYLVTTIDGVKASILSKKEEWLSQL